MSLSMNSSNLLPGVNFFLEEKLKEQLFIPDKEVVIQPLNLFKFIQKEMTLKEIVESLGGEKLIMEKMSISSIYQLAIPFKRRDGLWNIYFLSSKTGELLVAHARYKKISQKWEVFGGSVKELSNMRFSQKTRIFC